MFQRQPGLEQISKDRDGSVWSLASVVGPFHCILLAQVTGSNQG